VPPDLRIAPLERERLPGVIKLFAGERFGGGR